MANLPELLLILLAKAQPINMFSKLLKFVVLFCVVVFNC